MLGKLATFSVWTGQWKPKECISINFYYERGLWWTQNCLQSEVINPTPTVPGLFLVGLETAGLAYEPCRTIYKTMTPHAPHCTSIMEYWSRIMWTLSRVEHCLTYWIKWRWRTWNMYKTKKTYWRQAWDEAISPQGQGRGLSKLRGQGQGQCIVIVPEDEDILACPHEDSKSSCLMLI